MAVNHWLQVALGVYTFPACLLLKGESGSVSLRTGLLGATGAGAPSKAPTAGGGGLWGGI